MAGKGWYLVGGVVLGVGAYYIYIKYQQTKPNTVDVKLTTRTKIPDGAIATFSVVKPDQDKTEVIAEIPLTKVDENTYTGQASLKALPEGAYIAYVNFYKDDKYIGTLDAEITMPNDMGLSIPSRVIYGENKIELNLRG